VLEIARRIVLVGLLASAIVSLAGQWLAVAALPVMSLVSQALHPGFYASLDLQTVAPMTVRLTLTAVAPARVGSFLLVPLGDSITAEAHLAHVLVPAVLPLIVAAAWPVRGPRARVMVMLGSTAIGALAMCVIAPLQLAGLVQSSFESFAEANGIAFEQTTVVSLLLFMESGGRWVLPLIAAGLACVTIAPPRRLHTP